MRRVGSALDRALARSAAFAGAVFPLGLRCTLGRAVNLDERRDREAAEARARLQAAIDEGLASPETDTKIADIVAAARRGR